MKNLKTGEFFTHSKSLFVLNLRRFTIIGEATKRLSDEIRGKYPDIPWKDMAGMRDKLIHGYLGVDMDALWDTVKNDIPLLKSKLKNLIEKGGKM